MGDSDKLVGSGKVQVTLSLDNSSQNLPFPERVLTLDRENTSIMVGRASRVESKGLLSLRDNAYFLSPVVSRRHAEISADLDERKVILKDLGSMHGTYINGAKAKLPIGKPHELKHGDKLRLGTQIQRQTEIFPATTVDVGIVFYDNEHDNPTTTFQVPDCSDVEDFSSDEDLDIKDITESTMPAFPSMKSTPNVIDLTQPLRRNLTTYCEVIDLSSPPRSPRPTSDDDGDSDIIEAPSQAAEITRDTQSSSRPTSPDLTRASPGLDAEMPYLDEYQDKEGHSDYDYDVPFEASTDEEGNSGDDNANSDSDEERRSVDDAGDELDDELDRLQSEEESFFDNEDQDSEDEEPDLEEEILDYSESDDEANNGFPDASFKSAFWENDTKVSFNRFPHLAAYLAGKNINSSLKPSQMEKPPATKSSNTPNIQNLLNRDNVPVNVHQPAVSEVPAYIARRPSPSDAILPKSSPATLFESGRPASEILGEKAGKAEFFAAREINKSRFTPSVYAICNDIGFNTSVHSFRQSQSLPSTDGLFLKRDVEIQVSEAPLNLPDVNISQLPWTKENMDIPSIPDSDVDLEVSSFPEAGTLVAEPPQRTHLGISDILDDSCQLTPAPAKEAVPKQTLPETKCEIKIQTAAKPKRKLGEVSQSTTEEEHWAQGPSRQEQSRVFEKDTQVKKNEQVEPANSTQTTVPPEMHTGSTVVMPENLKGLTSMPPGVDERPAKRIRHFAERLGYAALGGVATGAMIFGTLVYTAPTFV